ncbi:MAG: hypothetical protein KKI18_06425 [Planctomycetes bacterium]|nr:hypothetical protein [Planctomycetota bacterium]MBU1518526.1 hypothetical protein [Planctomycetota bacterium]
MRKKLIYLISFVVLLALAGNASADLDSDPCLVAHYTLDGDANDTGNVSPADNGVLYGDPVWTNGRTGLGGSIDLDGTGDWVQIPDANKLDITDDLTVAFWLRVDDFGSVWQTTVIKGTSWNTHVWKFEQSGENPGSLLWRVGGEATTGVGVVGVTDVNDGKWHHIAGTYEKATGSLILYIDGVYDASALATPGTAIPTDDPNHWPLYISLVKDGEYIDGGCDDLRIYRRVLSAEEIAVLGYNIPYLQAHSPDPSAGQAGVSADANLSWTKGDYALTHDVYFGTSEPNVANATKSIPLGVYKTTTTPDTNTTYTPLVPLELGNKTYYWRVDEVNDANSDIWPGWVWSFASASASVSNPSPADGYQYAAPDTKLTWTAGYGALRHKVFFGTVSPPPLITTILMTDPDPTTWDPPGDLVKGQTYYWMIVAYDYLLGGSGNVAPGPEWSFRATNGLRAWWKFDDGDGNTPVDSSGNSNDAVFGISPNSLPAWTTDGRIGGALEFDGDQDWVEVRHDPNLDITKSMTLAVWIKINNFGGDNQSIIGKFDNWKFERAGTSGTILWCIEGGAPWTTYGNISIDDGGWHHLTGTYDGTTGVQTLYVDGVQDTQTSGTTPHTIPTSTNPLYIGSNGLDCIIDDLRVYDYNLSASEIGALVDIPWPPYARTANPVNKSTVAMEPDKLLTLSWVAGPGAASHDVYFGTSLSDVNDANHSIPAGIFKINQVSTTYGVGPLETEKTYYWRIDEVNDANSDIWKGFVWRFTTAEYFSVDSFEDYTNTSPKRIFDPNGWIYGGGGYVDFSDSNLVMVHGGQQAMSLDCDNLASPYDSNATRTFGSSQNWTVDGVKSLELWVRGWPAYVGSWTEVSGTHTITAAGEDIWNVPNLKSGTGYHDEFHYAYKEITGSGSVTIIAKVDSIDGNTSPWAKVGVMVRQSLDPNSKNALMCITPEMGAAFQYRQPDANSSTSYDYYTSGEDYVAMRDINAPYWVRLEVTSSGGVDASYSLNGTDFDSHYVTAPRPYITLPYYVGLAVTAHNVSEICTAQFSNVSITGGTQSGWSNGDIGIYSNVAALPLYITLEDDSVGSNEATITHTDPNIVLQSTWQAWDIALSDFTGVDLTKIKKITLGVGPADPCGTGTLYIDDIRLYPPRCMFGRTGDFTGDCFVNCNDLKILADNWLSSSPADPGIDLNDDDKINFGDFAIMASQWFEEALWPIE